MSRRITAAATASAMAMNTNSWAELLILSCDDSWEPSCSYTLDSSLEVCAVADTAPVDVAIWLSRSAFAPPPPCFGAPRMTVYTGTP